MTTQLADTCAWFAACDNEADHLVRHRVLGDVPTCQRCVDHVGLHDLIVADRQPD